MLPWRPKATIYAKRSEVSAGKNLWSGSCWAGLQEKHLMLFCMPTCCSQVRNFPWDCYSGYRVEMIFGEQAVLAVVFAPWRKYMVSRLFAKPGAVQECITAEWSTKWSLIRTWFINKFAGMRYRSTLPRSTGWTALIGIRRSATEDVQKESNEENPFHIQDGALQKDFLCLRSPADVKPSFQSEKRKFEHPSEEKVTRTKLYSWTRWR